MLDALAAEGYAALAQSGRRGDPEFRRAASSLRASSRGGRSGLPDSPRPHAHGQDSHGRRLRLPQCGDRERVALHHLTAARDRAG